MNMNRNQMKQENASLCGVPSPGGDARTTAATTAAGNVTTTTAAAARLPYEAPAVEVISVRTERGYAASGAASPWDPTPW